MLQINSNIKDDFQVVLLLSCFVGHPVYKVAAAMFKQFNISWYRTMLLYKGETNCRLLNKREEDAVRATLIRYPSHINFIFSTSGGCSGSRINQVSDPNQLYLPNEGEEYAVRATFISCIRSALTSFSQRGGGECIVSHINQVSDPQQTDQNQQCTSFTFSSHTIYLKRNLCVCF